MRRYIISLSVIILTSTAFLPVLSQKISNSVNQIIASDLESHVSFLASPLLKGRMNGEEGLEIAAQYLVSQAKLLGLKPANANSYFQPYSVEKKSIDREKSKIQIISAGIDTVTLRKPIFTLLPPDASDFTIEGEAVFAGYGLKADKYNDFENLKTDEKILLIMNRAPLSEDGKEFLFGDTNWSSFISIQMKIVALLYSGAKAILIVSDPKSGFFLLMSNTLKLQVN